MAGAQLKPAPPDEPGLSRALVDRVSAVAVLALACIVYANAMPAVALHDDAFFIPAPHALDAQALRRAFTQDAWGSVGGESGLYRPLTLLSIAVDGALWGSDASGYHRTNVLLHALASVAVLLLLRALSDARTAWPSVLGAAVFAAHPIHTEAVDSVFNRSEILATLLLLAALLVLARGWRTAPVAAWTAASALFFAALSCRESAIAFPLLALAMLWLAHPGVARRPTLRELAPAALLILPASAYFVLRHAALAAGAEHASPLFGVAPPQGALARAFYSLAQLREYARMLAWPRPLRLSYEDFTGEGFRSAVLVNVALLGTAVLCRRRTPLLTLALAFFYAALLPSTQLVAAAAHALSFGAIGVNGPLMPLLVAERVAYLPSVGLALALAVGLAALERRRGSGLPIAFGVVLTLVGGYAAWHRNLDWHDAVRLYEAEVAAAPDNGDAYRHLIAAYLAANQQARAERTCDAQLERERRSAYFFVNCGSVYYDLRRDDAALHAYRRAIELGLASVGHVNAGRVHLRAGRRREAEAEYAAAAEAETTPLLRHYRRGVLLEQFHPERRDEALSEYRSALELQPEYAPARRAVERLTH